MTNTTNNFIGQYVICRTRNEGVNFGKVLAYGIGFVDLEEAQRMYYFAPAEKSESLHVGRPI